jgi:hypothetical protein
MRAQRASALTVMMFLFVMRLAAQVNSVKIENPPAGPLGADPIDLTIVATSDGTPAKQSDLHVGVNSTARIKNVGDEDDKFASSLEVKTDDEGEAQITLKPADKNADVILTVMPKAGGETATFSWLGIRKFTIENKMGPLTPRTVYPKAIVITAKGKDDLPAASQRMKVSIIGASDARLFTDATPARGSTVEVKTDEAGVAGVSVETGENLDVELRVDPLDSEGNEVVIGEQTVKLSGLRTFDTFHSRRLYTELFMGGTFTNDYDADGKSTGFNKTAPLVRATFDTLWYHRVPCQARRRHKCDPEPPAGTLVPGSLWHTGVDMEVSSFPFGSGNPQKDPDTGETTPGPKGLDNAFSGTLFAVYQPDRWASYTQTSELNGFPTDALRLGIFGKLGMTTRPTLADNGDSSFWRGQIGLRFTHHQTKVNQPYNEQDNIVPIRFIEISYGRFEQFGDERNANRIVIDAGIRLPGLGSNQIPFYAGIHLNGGRGVDDLRIFAGFLFKINELATLFPGARTESPRHTTTTDNP